MSLLIIYTAIMWPSSSLNVFPWIDYWCFDSLNMSYSSTTFYVFHSDWHLFLYSFHLFIIFLFTIAKFKYSIRFFSLLYSRILPSAFFQEFISKLLLLKILYIKRTIKKKKRHMTNMTIMFIIINLKIPTSSRDIVRHREI